MHHRRTLRPGFTLIELLIVVIIIALLIGIALAVGSKVASSGKDRATADILKTLDTSLTQFIAVTGSIPAAYTPHPNQPRGRYQYVIPTADARDTGIQAQDMINSVALYVQQTRGYAEVESIFKGIDPKFIRSYTPMVSNGGQGQDGQDRFAGMPSMLTVFDAHGNPIRFVHPRWDGLLFDNTPSVSVKPEDVAEPPDDQPGVLFQITVKGIRRNNVATGDQMADSDGGLCPGDTPYFYSVGKDGDPSTIDDNVYTTRPQFQKAQ